MNMSKSITLHTGIKLIIIVKMFNRKQNILEIIKH